MAKDFYAILGVGRGASDKDIRSAYRKLARKLHPDVNPGDRASEARFKEVNAAHDVLSDAEKRKKYDRYGDNWEHAAEFERAQGARGGRSRFYTYSTGPNGEFAPGDIGDPGALGDLFGGIFGGGRRRAARPRQLNIDQPVEVTLEEAFAGTTRLLVVDTEAGAGRRLELRIPPGVDSGSRVRMAGEGRAGLDGARGDLYLVVSVRPHDRFERKGDELYVDVEAPLTTAVLGGEIEVATVDKKVALKLPPLTQNGRVFRLSGLGMPRLNQVGRGDLYARVRVRLPETLAESEKALFEELKAAGV